METRQVDYIDGRLHSRSRPIDEDQPDLGLWPRQSALRVRGHESLEQNYFDPQP